MFSQLAIDKDNMQGYNLIVVYNHKADKILLCERLKEPYLGLYNFIGGKIETGESSLSAAYRELFEETGIKEGDIKLVRLMDFVYFLQNCYVEVFAGRLNSNIKVGGEENRLFWHDSDINFFDPIKFAGEGNMGHIIEQIKMYKDIILKI